MNDRLTELAREMYACGAFKDRTHPTAIERNGERGFRLKLHDRTPDAPLSPFYLNLRTIPDGPLSEDVVQRLSLALHWESMIAGLNYQYLVGLPHAGEPFARFFPRMRYPLSTEATLLYLSKEKLPDGTRRICGPVAGKVYGPRKTVLVIDDLITQADTKLEGIRVLEENGFVVRDVLVIVDREQGGREQLKQAGYSLHALFTIGELLDYYCSLGYITPELYHDIVQYLAR